MKTYVAIKTKWTDPPLIHCIKYLSNTVFTKIQEYILIRVHGGGAGAGTGPTGEGNRARGRGNHVGIGTTGSSIKIQRKNEKLIPSLIYEVSDSDIDSDSDSNSSILACVWGLNVCVCVYVMLHCTPIYI